MQLFSPKTNEKSSAFIDAVYPDSVRPRADRNLQNVDSTLYAYYRWCNNNIRDSVVLLKADTLFRLAGEKNDIRMQAVALSFKADHYYFNNELDSLKAWIPRVQAFARANEQPTYYFFTWSRLILYYTKHGQYTLAQYELERYMAQADRTTTSPPSPKPTSS